MCVCVCVCEGEDKYGVQCITVSWLMWYSNV